MLIKCFNHPWSVYSKKKIGMLFTIWKKCSPDQQGVRRGRVGRGGDLVMAEGIVILGKRLSRAIIDFDEDAYKYLGVLEGHKIKHSEMKRIIEKGYFRRVRKNL